MSDKVIYAWRGEQGDVWTGEWALDRKEKWVPAEAVEYTRSDLCVTRADLEAAVALALEGAAASARGHAKFTQEAMAKAPAQHIMSNLVQVTQSRTAYAIEDAILALIQPHQADALARVRQEAHNAAIEAAAEVVAPPDEDCGCDECYTRSKSAMHIRALALPVEGGAKG